MDEFIPKDETVWLAPELPMAFLVGDIVTRDGTDEHEVLRIDAGDNCMHVRCIKAPASGWAKVGEDEFNLIRRYTFLRPGPLRLSQRRGDGHE